MKHLYYYPLILFLLLSANTAFAVSDLSISQTDITFSKNTILSGDTVKVYARIFNNGPLDVTGSVVFLNNGKEIGIPQPVSLKPSTYDDVFIEWKAAEGTHSIEAKIINIKPADENTTNNQATAKEVTVTADTNHNAIPGEQEQAKTDNKTEILNANNIAEKNASLFGSIQTDIENFRQSNPIKSALDSFDKKISDTFHKLYNNPKEMAEISSYTFAWPASIANAFKNNMYIYLGLGGLALIILYTLMRKKRKNNDNIET